MLLPKSFQVLVEQISKLPGIGKRSATRIAISLVNNKDYAQSLNSSINEAMLKCVECDSCGNLMEKSVNKNECQICLSNKRNREKLCIVQSYSDLLSIEDAGFFDGLYHILGGVISPLDGVYEEDLRLESLYQRINKNEEIKEIIFSLPQGLEADATFSIIKNNLMKIKSSLVYTRFAVGLPVGSSIDYVDGNTISKAYENRVEV